jgi:hypothetical protein
MQDLSRGGAVALYAIAFSPSKRTDFESFAAVTSSRAGIIPGCSAKTRSQPLQCYKMLLTGTGAEMMTSVTEII